MRKLVFSFIVFMFSAGIVYAGLEKANELFSQKKYSEALEAYKSILPQLSGRDASRAQMSIGLSFLHMGDEARAIKELMKVKDVEGDYPSEVANAFFRIGVIHYRQRRYEDAIEAFKEAVEVENAPRPIRTRSQLFIGYSLRRQDKLEEAVAALSMAKEIFGSAESIYVVDAQLTLGEILVNIDRADEAEKAFKKALSERAVNFARLNRAMSHITDLSDMEDIFIMNLKEDDERSRKLLLKIASENKPLAEAILKAFPEDSEIVEALKVD